MSLSWRVRGTALLGASCLLAACYVSDDPLIPQGEATLPVDHSLTLCPDGPDNCVAMQVDGDGYVTAPEADPDESGAARFYPLMQVDGRQIYLLEARDSDAGAYTYLVARRRTADAANAAMMDLALVSCSDLTAAQRTTFLDAGGQISAGWGSECTAPDLSTLTATLRSVYTEKFADEAWWAEGGAD